MSYYHLDGNGSVRALSNSSKTITDTYSYNAFGELISSSGSTVNPFRWLGSAGIYDDSARGSVFGLLHLDDVTYAPPIGFLQTRKGPTLDKNGRWRDNKGRFTKPPEPFKVKLERISKLLGPLLGCFKEGMKGYHEHPDNPELDIQEALDTCTSCCEGLATLAGAGIGALLEIVGATIGGFVGKLGGMLVCRSICCTIITPERNCNPKGLPGPPIDNTTPPVGTGQTVFPPNGVGWGGGRIG